MKGLLWKEDCEGKRGEQGKTATEEDGRDWTATLSM